MRKGQSCPSEQRAGGAAAPAAPMALAPLSIPIDEQFPQQQKTILLCLHQ